MITPFFNFAGQANEAMKFYENIFHGQDKRILRYSDVPKSPDFPYTDDMKDYVLHAEMTISGTKVSFSDTQSEVVKMGMISLAVDYKTQEEVRDAYAKLIEGGEVLMELAPTFFSSLFGWVLDKFGISWQLIYQ